jgi:hypothetical protein
MEPIGDGLDAHTLGQVFQLPGLGGGSSGRGGEDAGCGKREQGQRREGGCAAGESYVHVFTP